ncbi:MAG: hypothetical protein DMF25_05485 [Verrucomicrobia bacterium]|nr:MAG: hypothetical protein DMF25_05485 [Verrucomicrobiota bacterium]
MGPIVYLRRVSPSPRSRFLCRASGRFSKLLWQRRALAPVAFPCSSARSRAFR